MGHYTTIKVRIFLHRRPRETIKRQLLALLWQVGSEYAEAPHQTWLIALSRMHVPLSSLSVYSHTETSQQVVQEHQPPVFTITKKEENHASVQFQIIKSISISSVAPELRIVCKHTNLETCIFKQNTAKALSSHTFKFNKQTSRR